MQLKARFAYLTTKGTKMARIKNRWTFSISHNPGSAMVDWTRSSRLFTRAQDAAEAAANYMVACLEEGIEVAVSLTKVAD